MARDKKLIIGNWKMNLNVHEASLFLHRLEKQVKVHRNVEAVISPTTLALQTLSLQVNLRQFKLAAQNFYWRDYGAFTGEVSATQLRGIVSYGLVGHSERRHYFHENDKDIRAKVQAAIRNNIIPVVCVGETAGERANSETSDVIRDQLLGALANVTGDEAAEIVVAYEPVWAIGTGDNARPADVASAIRTIRDQLKHLFGARVSQEIKIIYGGSVTSVSAPDYLVLSDLDGLLLGGASLDVKEFSEIIEQAHKSQKGEK